ncbi:hypothetical protein LINGRAHAP2_LOCUS12870 [Linum grandiflorum]
MFVERRAMREAGFTEQRSPPSSVSGRNTGRKKNPLLEMGTREVYEQKLLHGNLHHDPTIKPGLGSPRCPRCLSSLVDADAEIGEWAVTSVLHDATAVAGSGIGAMLSAVHGFNTGIPFLQNRLPLVVGFPPLLMYSAACATFAGCVLPKFAQLMVTSYYAASSASHYGISLLTREIEEAHTSRVDQEIRK